MEIRISRVSLENILILDIIEKRGQAIGWRLLLIFRQFLV